MIITAVPAKTGDLSTAEGRHVPAYGSPYGGAYAPPAAPKYGSATVTSYNRRGSYAQASEFAKPTIYGTSYGAQPSVRAPAYAPGPSTYASQTHGYASPALEYAAPSANYGGYGGPQSNAYSSQSQLLSQDPHYDAGKDPVSQYAAYVPVREYAPKSQSNGNELSIYGYRK